MRNSDIEAWALSVLDRVTRQQPVEDDRVELKSEWLPAPKVARRLAGHANAARGESILWLIGVDEKKGVTGTKREEFANWWPQVQSHFESAIAPTPKVIVVPSNEKSVVAILLETDRAPFIVKNPKHGGEGGNVEWEVPWREGTSTRTAHRADLLKLLVPIRRAPRIDVLGGALTADTSNPDAIIHLKTQIFVEQDSDRAIFLRHRCSGTLETRQHPKFPLEGIAVKVADPGSERGTFSNSFIACFADPGVLELEASATSTDRHILEADFIQVTLMLATNSPTPLLAQFELRRIPRTSGTGTPPTEWAFGVLVMSEEEQYKTWVDAMVSALSQGKGNSVGFSSDVYEWAARAVREGRLTWAPIPFYLMLPGMS